VYTVTCPSCGYAIQLSFALNGAAGRCPSCQRVVTVDKSTLRVEGAAPLASPPPAAKLDPETPRLDAEGNVIGLSGLSHLLKQTDGDAKAKARPAAAAKPAPARNPVRPPATMPRQGLILIVAAVAVVGLLGLAIWYVTLPTQGKPASSVPPADATAPATTEAP